ncbi:hypothetical protein P3T76_001611 [Phytophthora citrophthora]|uniref:CBS domain-containing protein n=1 Tax=Phytophthora citrophthora TaxID=4793 RepID=A0AAD9LT02_9STRA|nr:hypothetical protein P3T76_001611 [Phytophthora citrophthora]
MGAALATRVLSDPQHLELLSEYVDHSRKTADECAHIFRGSLGMYDDEQNDAPTSTLGERKPAYPRHIQLAQFEEVFGMLVADPEPHFRFFHYGKIVPADTKLKPEVTVCAHRIFCAVTLLMKADLHSKVDFILRLYADIAGTLTPEAKSSLLKDFVTSVEEVLQLSDPIPSNITTNVEKAFWSDDPEKLMTVRELYDVCLTNPQISGILHSIHALIEEFSSSRRQEMLRQRENKAQAQQTSIRCGGDSNSSRMKSIARSMSSAALPQGSLLWDLKAGDYENFWQQPVMLQLSANETCAYALEQMVQHERQSVLVVEASDLARPETCRLLGVVSADKLFLYFLQILVPGLQSPTAKPYEHTRARAEEAILQFGRAPLRDAIRFCWTERSPLVGSIRDDEAFFSVLMRFACGESSVAVVQDYSPNPEAVLGCLTIYDVLAWLDEDLTLLSKYGTNSEGKEHCAVAAFPQFFYVPAALDPSSASTSVCEGLVEMASRKVFNILVETSTEKKILSVSTFRELFPPSFAALNEKEAEPGPLLGAVIANATVLSSALAVPPDASIARVIREMVDNQTRRILIQRQDGFIVGSVRASDIVQMLLRAQHKPLR